MGRLGVVALFLPLALGCDSERDPVQVTAPEPAFDAVPEFGIRDLHDNGAGWLASKAYDINADGLIAGEATPGGVLHAIRWTLAGLPTDVHPAIALASSARAINTAGRLAGWVLVPPPVVLGSPRQHAAVWSADGVASDRGVGDCGSTAFDLNDAGQLVGRAQFLACEDPLTVHGPSLATLWSAEGAAQSLGTLGGAASVAWGINNLGHVVGESETAAGLRHAFLYTPATGMVDLGGVLRNAIESIAYDINDAGEIVGQATVAVQGGGTEPHVFVISGGRARDLGNGRFAALDKSFSINELGDIVGSIGPEGGEHAVVWFGAGGLIDLPPLNLLPSNAAALNDARQIVGHSAAVTGNFHAVLWAVDIEAADGELADLIAAVQALCAPGGVLNRGQCTSLLAKLDAAEAAIARGQPATARRELEAFIAEVAAFIRAGVLTAAQGQPLIDSALGIIAGLGD